MKKNQKIAVLGPKGTFSEHALDIYNQNNYFEPVFTKTIHECFTLLAENIVDLIIVPVENTLDGYIQQTLDLMYLYSFNIINEIIIPVKFSYISLTDNLNFVNKLYVQFVTKGQCQKFINKLDTANIVLTESNMESFYLVKNDYEGAIVPFHMLDSFKGYKINDVTDIDNNQTRFVVLSNNKIVVNKGHFKASIVITPFFDKPGLLYEILKEFASININLISIMSRPRKNQLGTYHFFIELEGTFDLIDKLNSLCFSLGEKIEIKILGIYNT